MRRLYQDIDGALNRLDVRDENKFPSWRKDAPAFLKWALKHFLVSFLTGWKEKSEIRDGCLAKIGLRSQVDRFGYPQWGFDKTDGIEFGYPFYWIDDEVTPVEEDVLREHGKSDRLIRINPHGEGALQEVSRILALRESKEYSNIIPDLSGKVPEEIGYVPLRRPKKIRSRTTTRI